MADLNDLSFETFKLWSLNALRIYLSVRKKADDWKFRRNCSEVSDLLFSSERQIRFLFFFFFFFFFPGDILEIRATYYTFLSKNA